MPRAHDPEALREALKEHSVRGYRVRVPVLGDAVVEGQTATGGGFVFFHVRAERPMPFDEFARKIGVQDEPWTLDQWREKFVAKATRTLPAMASHLRESLEEGGRVSQKDVLFAELADRGCMDGDQNVTCSNFDSRQVEMRELRRGDVVEFLESIKGEESWPGRIVGADGKYPLLELFAPLPLMMTPIAVVTEAIRAGFYSQETPVLGRGTGHMLEDAGEIPRGRWSEDCMEYFLDEPVALSRVEEWCSRLAKERHRKDCLWQSMVMFILPIDPKEGVFRPMPEGTNPELYVVEYGEQE